jgi:hypothetical protein
VPPINFNTSSAFDRGRAYFIKTGERCPNLSLSTSHGVHLGCSFSRAGPVWQGLKSKPSTARSTNGGTSENSVIFPRNYGSLWSLTSEGLTLYNISGLKVGVIIFETYGTHYMCSRVHSTGLSALPIARPAQATFL